MKNGLTLFLGVFATLAVSWAALLLSSHKQLGSLPQFKDPVEDTLNPAPLSGLAEQGRMVYQDLGCVTCHTQQVRREGYGNDVGDREHGRGWGSRGGYARDYIRDHATLIGSSRLGPDLRNVGSRIPDAEYFYKLLYAPESKLGGQPIAHGMPPHKFLFEERPVAGNQPSYKAVHVPSGFGPGEGYEIVPTRRAEALVAYLQSLKDTYDYPVERDLNTPAAHQEEHGGAKAPAEKPKEGGH